MFPLKNLARKGLSFEICCALYQRFDGSVCCVIAVLVLFAELCGVSDHHPGSRDEGSHMWVHKDRMGFWRDLWQMP